MTQTITQAFTTVGEQVELLASFSQQRLLENIGRNLLNDMGWNRATRERVLEETLARVTKQDALSWDDAGVFDGLEPTTAPLDPQGHTTEDVWSFLTEKQVDFMKDLILQEDALWRAYDAAEEAWRELTSESKGNMVKPFPAEKATGAKTLDDIVEFAKRKAIAWRIAKEEAEAEARRKQGGKSAEWFKAMEAKMRQR